MPPFAESSDNMETSAFAYTRRFTMFIWNAVLQTTFNLFGPIFSQETFMAAFNDPSAILEAKLPWTIWRPPRLRISFTTRSYAASP